MVMRKTGQKKKQIAFLKDLANLSYYMQDYK